ncbi:MAG: hypothetical protein Q9161_006930 [Pseudevernia consocians]
MLELLNSERLDALLRDADDAGCAKISAARYFFEKQDLAQGLEALLQAFKIFNPYLFFEEKDGLRVWKAWHIDFYEAPFNSLQIRPADSHIEIFKNGNFVKAYLMSDSQNWVRMLRWLWFYGEETYATNVKNGSMVRPLDPCRLAALASVKGSDECDFVQSAKAYLSKEKDLANGVLCLFEGWEVFAPRLRREKEWDEKWHLTFRNSPFRSLQIQPSANHDIVDVYAFNKMVASFHIVDNPKVADPQMWQRLLRWTWDYGRRRLIQKQESQAMQRVSKTHAKSQCRLKCIGESLLRKVLNMADFKAHYGANTRTKDLKVKSGKEDVSMKDVDLPKDVSRPLRRQLFTQKLPLCTTDPNAHLGIAWKPNFTREGHLGLLLNGARRHYACEVLADYASLPKWFSFDQRIMRSYDDERIRFTASLHEITRV